jgi:hypothetical protein
MTGAAAAFTPELHIDARREAASGWSRDMGASWVVGDWQGRNFEISATFEFKAVEYLVRERKNKRIIGWWWYCDSIKTFRVTDFTEMASDKYHSNFKYHSNSKKGSCRKRGATSNEILSIFV